MSDTIIDTNVMVVANRQNAAVADECQDACIRFLIEARTSRVVLIDSGDEIRAEYARALQTSPPHQIGAQFLFHIYQQRYDPRRVRIVDLAKTPEGEFVDFPQTGGLAAFDVSDRKFAALARSTGTAVTNATDSDWLDFREMLQADGIAVDFLCGCERRRWFKP